MIFLIKMLIEDIKIYICTRMYACFSLSIVAVGRDAGENQCSAAEVSSILSISACGLKTMWRFFEVHSEKAGSSLPGDLSNLNH